LNNCFFDIIFLSLGKIDEDSAVSIHAIIRSETSWTQSVICRRKISSRV